MTEEEEEEADQTNCSVLTILKEIYFYSFVADIHFADSSIVL